MWLSTRAWSRQCATGDRIWRHATERTICDDPVESGGEMMNCPRCGTEWPAGAAYCPSCGTPKSEIERLFLDAARVANRAVDAGVGAIDRAAMAIQPTVNKAVQAIRPAVEGTARALEPVARDVASATKEVANAVGPVAEKAVRKTKAAAVKAADATQRAARKVSAKARKH